MATLFLKNSNLIIISVIPNFQDLDGSFLASSYNSITWLMCLDVFSDEVNIYNIMPWLQLQVHFRKKCTSINNSIDAIFLTISSYANHNFFSESNIQSFNYELNADLNADSTTVQPNTTTVLDYILHIYYELTSDTALFWW